VLLGELDRETQTFGRAVPSGIVTHTGVAGLTLGGGIGWIMRKYGLSIDNLVSVDVVTADGEFVKASENENAELFWGVRGGGGNFGIVTDFEFRLHPLGPQVMAGPVFWPMEDAPEVLRFYRDWIADCPDELMTIVVQRRAPALPVVPPELVGKHVIAVAALLRRPRRGRRTGARAPEAVREPRARPVHAEAVPRPSGHVRPVVPARLVVLRALVRRRRAHR
jgi:FAD/FMN-containing dehydrogenase